VKEENQTCSQKWCQWRSLAASGRRTRPLLTQDSKRVEDSVATQVSRLPAGVTFQIFLSLLLEPQYEKSSMKPAGCWRCRQGVSMP